MAYRGLEEYIAKLESCNELVRITEPVSTNLEITEIADRVMKSSEGGKALLFENNGTDFPLLINGFGSDNRMALSLGVDNIDEISDSIDTLFKELSAPKKGLWDKLKTLPSLQRVASYMPHKSSRRGACQEVIDLDPDLSKLPVLTCWPADGGPFITLPSVITEDPVTGIRNVGMYRMQVLDKQSTGMHWHKHKTGARHYNEYKRLGERMPISVALGGDPAYTFSATAPLPDNIDEYMLAGYTRKKRVTLVKSITNNIYVPADADIIIEGYVDPTEEFVYEGPFGDHTGFYSLADYYPRFHVTAITYRKGAIYPATIVGIPPMEDAYIQRASERIFLAPMKMVLVPEIVDMDLPPAGVAHNITVAKIEKSYIGQARKCAYAMWGAGQMMFNKCLIVVDGNANIHNYTELAQLISERVVVTKDLFFSEGPLDVLDHSSSIFTYGSKIGIDATGKEIEREDQSQKNITFSYPTISDITALDSGIVDARVDLHRVNISLVIVVIDRDQIADSESFSTLKERLASSNLFNGYKFVAIVDKGIDTSELDSVAWYLSGNIDPTRDIIIEEGSDTINPRAVIDGTRKSTLHDNFQREWPNPVVMSEDIISQVNRRWSELGLGEEITSPSLRFVALKRGGGAVADEECLD